MQMYDHITAQQADLIRESKIFFIASVHPELALGSEGEGPVNISPKGGVPLHIIDDNHVAYLDYPGSGNATARHAAVSGPVTLMVMSMSAEDAAIVRLYGQASVCPVADSPHADRILEHQTDNLSRPRQIIEITVEKTQTSCGYGVPVFEFVGERSTAGRGRKYKESTRQTST